MSSVAEKLQRKSQRQVAVKQVRLKLVYIDFWSAVKLSFLVAVSLGIVLIVAAILVWIVLNSTGIFGDLDDIMKDILGDPTFRVTSSFSPPQVALYSFVIALLNVVVGTALGAIARNSERNLENQEVEEPAEQDELEPTGKDESVDE